MFRWQRVTLIGGIAAAAYLLGLVTPLAVSASWPVTIPTEARSGSAVLKADDASIAVQVR